MMKRTVYKYPVMLAHEWIVLHGQSPEHVSDPFAVVLPVGAVILHVAVQDGRPVIWAHVTITGTAMEMTRRFRFAYTGAHLPADVYSDRHVATLDDAGIVMHMFEVA